MDDAKLIPLSALQHYAFCPRQCALIHNEQAWADNYLTAQGNKLHKRVDSGELETRNGTRFERSVMVRAKRIGITGRLDLVEKNVITGALTPVEYKKGKSKSGEWDKIQLCAQVLCLEEMTGNDISEASLWYWQTRRRETVEMGQSLRKQTLEVIAKVKEIFSTGESPKPKYTTKCDACSLIDICNPKLVQNDKTGNYIKQLFEIKDGL